MIIKIAIINRIISDNIQGGERGGVGVLNSSKSVWGTEIEGVLQS